MSRATLALTVVAVAATATSFFLWRELTRQQERYDALYARVVELQRQQRAWTTPAEVPSTPREAGAAPDHSAAKPDVSTAPAQPSASRSPARSSAPSPAPSSAQPPVAVGPIVSPMGIPMARSAELLKNPEFRAAMLEQQMFSLRRMYSDVGEALRLSPEEVDALFETLADHQLESMELAQEFLPRPGSAPDPDRVAEMRQRMAEIQRKQYEAIASRLGEARAQEWQQYLSTVPARWEVRELRAALAEAGEPLSSQQIEVLVDAIAQERRRPTSVAQNAPQSFSGPPSTRERIALLEQSFERIEQSNRRIREAVAPYLSPTQLAALERHQQQQLEMNRAGMRLSRLQRQALQQGGAIDATGAAVMGFVAVPVEPPADSSR